MKPQRREAAAQKLEHLHAQHILLRPNFRHSVSSTLSRMRQQRKLQESWRVAECFQGFAHRLNQLMASQHQANPLTLSDCQRS